MVFQKKAPQHESAQDGCDTSRAIFLCITFALTWSTTDQYAPSLPQMGVDLSGSQAVMSATVQSNFVVKSVFGLFTVLACPIASGAALPWSVVYVC